MIILNKEGVETNVPDNYALQEGEVLKQVVPEPTPIDYEKEYFALLEKEAKTAEDRDNYKQGLLAAKGKIPEVTPPPAEIVEDIDALIEKKVAEKLQLAQKLALQKEKDDLVKKVIAENKELKRAIETKDGVSTVTPGSSVAKEDVVKQHWTKEQLEYFKKRGLNPDLVKGNYDKYRASKL